MAARKSALSATSPDKGSAGASCKWQHPPPKHQAQRTRAQEEGGGGSLAYPCPNNATHWGEDGGEEAYSCTSWPARPCRRKGGGGQGENGVEASRAGTTPSPRPPPPSPDPRHDAQRRLNHAAAQAQHQVQRGLLLDVVVRQRAPVLQLLAREDQALLVRGMPSLSWIFCFTFCAAARGAGAGEGGGGSGAPLPRSGRKRGWPCAHTLPLHRGSVRGPTLHGGRLGARRARGRTSGAGGGGGGGGGRRGGAATRRPQGRAAHLDGVAGLHIERDGLARQGLDLWHFRGGGRGQDVSLLACARAGPGRSNATAAQQPPNTETTCSMPEETRAHENLHFRLRALPFGESGLVGAWR
jgi:hypothetical protein